MNVIHHGPFRVRSLLWQPRAGAWAATIVCKATFELAPGASPLIPTPKSAPEAELQAAGDPRWLLELATDHAPLKRSPEVLVVGHVYAPTGTAETSLVARLSVGEVDKRIQVFGDRYLTREGALVGPGRFMKMPLLWERAAGGPGTSNPVGVRTGAGAPAAGGGRVALPNFEPVGRPLTTHDEAVPPVGFGPTAPSWPGRMARLHRHAATWDVAHWRERPLPEEVDFAYFNAAPADQALKELTGGERIELENLHPRFARLVTSLQGVTPGARASVEGGALRDVHLRCDTLVIDTDRGTATLVWRGNVPLSQPEQVGVVVVTDGRSGEGSMEETALGGAPGGPVMPFHAADPERSPVGAWVPFDGALWREEATPLLAVADVPPGDATGTLIGTPVGATTRPVLPFSAAAEDDEVETPRPPPVLEAGQAGAPRWAMRPAGVEVGGEAVTPHLAMARVLPGDATGTVIGTPVGVSARPVLPFGATADDDDVDTPRPQGVGSAPPVEAAWQARSVEPMSEERRELPAVRWAGVEPPPMIGPLATPEMVAGVRTIEKAPAAEVKVEKAVEEGPAVEAPLPLEEYPLERCARIAAQIARRPEEQGAILEAQELSAERWTALHEHWLGRIQEEAARSRRKLLSEYDAVYVGELEAKGGVITLEEYARLAEAAERGVVGEVLGGRGLPEGAWAHIHRVWIGRMVKDVRLGKEVRGAIEAVRGGGVSE